MRYIYIVAGLILIIVGVSGMTLLKRGTPASMEAVKVNGRLITLGEFAKTYDEKAASCPLPPDRKQFVDDLVTKEILIQEAKRLGLDREEAFRRSIQNYYEQTLLKNLTQKKMSEIKVSVSEEEIASYYAGMGKIYELKVLSVPSQREADEALRNFPSEKAEKRILRMDEIPHEMLDAVLGLKAGEVSVRPVPCKGFLVFRLDGYRTTVVPPLEKIHDEVRKEVEEKKRRSEMETWLEDLKKKSRVTINESVLE